MSQLETVATKAIYELQYNTNMAAKFITTEVPGTSREQAVGAINKVIKFVPAK